MADMPWAGYDCFRDPNCDVEGNPRKRKSRKKTMTKTFCDACRKETSCWKFSIPCHIAEDKRGYIDTQGNAVSGRMVDFDLCAACTNIAYSAAFLAFGKPKLESK